MAPTRRSPARERILAAADELFYYDGIGATGIDAVVERAQVALGSLYNHFDGKDSLVVAYLQHRDQRWRATWEQAIAECATAPDRLLAIYDALRNWVAEHGYDQGCAHVAALVQLPPNHPGVPVARRHKQHIRDRLTELADQAGYTAPRQLAGELAIVYEGLLATMLDTHDTAALADGRRVAEATAAGHR